jgi:hypothetical protein
MDDMKELSKEEKELLLKDLCARAPYGVKVQYNNNIYNIDYISPIYEEVKLDIPDYYTVMAFEVKPYLRSMRSMTEEELYEIQEILGKGIEVHIDFISIVDSSINVLTYLELQALFDWLNKNMFDYLGLIGKGLALKASRDMYKK